MAFKEASLLPTIEKTRNFTRGRVGDIVISVFALKNSEKSKWKIILT